MSPLTVTMPCGRKLESLNREALRRKAQSHIDACPYATCHQADHVRLTDQDQALLLVMPCPVLLIHGGGRYRRGCTLTEVLVACALVAMLSGLLYPVLSRATEQARVAACAARLHQLWLGYRLAALDRGIPLRDVLSEETYRYVGGERLWRCTTGSEQDRRYYLRLPVPDPPEGDPAFLADPWHPGAWLWVTLAGSVRTGVR